MGANNEGGLRPQADRSAHATAPASPLPSILIAMSDVEIFAEAWLQESRNQFFCLSDLQDGNEKRYAVCPWFIGGGSLVTRQREMSDVAVPAAFACAAVSVE
jgi:hypothetical protein